MTREHILTLWQLGRSADDIADELYVSRDTVFYHLRQARAAGDSRAIRRNERMPARRNRVKIELLSRLNLAPKSIARMVGITERMVQIRLKEMG